MIVTFHIALYLAYHLWDNYISVLFGNCSENTHANDNADDTFNESSIAVSDNHNRHDIQENINNHNLQLQSKNDTVVDEVERAEQVKTCKEALPPCIQHLSLDEKDMGSEVIYGLNQTYQFQSVVLDEKGIKFIPPVFTQRYMVIESILKSPSWEKNINKVVDFGCADLTFETRYLKKLFGIQEIIAVDKDSNLLSYYSCKVSPTPIDYLQPRPTPLSVRVFCGSVGHTHEVLTETDAVIAIELIEHLFPADLENLPFTVFGFMKPKLAIFTTPNADFNVLFPNFTGFRHTDHKFEWSRQQFEDWGNNLVQRYTDYSVTFHGIGSGPAGTEHLGCCSQMAVFVKDNDSGPLTENDTHIQEGTYTLINEYVYPYFVETRTLEEKIRDDAVYFINRCVSLNRHYNDEALKELPLKSVMEKVKCFSRHKLKDILAKANWEVITNSDGYEVVLIPDSDDEDNISNADDTKEIMDLAQIDTTDYDTTLTCDENWDYEDYEPKDINSTNKNSAGECICIPHHLQDSNSSSILSSEVQYINEEDIYKTKHNSLYSSLGEKSSDIAVLDASVVKTCNSDQNSVLEIDTNIDFSVYETPYSDDCRTIKSKCELQNTSVHSVHDIQQNTDTDCNKVLSFETPDVYNVCSPESKLPISELTTENTNNGCFSCVNSVSSPFDFSTYATPCCSQLHKKYIPKCLSLQQINTKCCSPPLSSDLENSSRGVVSICKQKDKFSKSMDGFKSQDSCDMHDTYSNASRVVDSGYPDSYSEYHMDMDLTPEQFDDIETESEGNDVSSQSLSPAQPPAVQIPHLVDDVENGDVANNNRDGEGNNVVADMEQEPLEFEAQIEEVNNEIPNLAVADQMDRGFVCKSPDFPINGKYSPQKYLSKQCHNSICLEQTPPENNDTAESLDFSDNYVSYNRLVKNTKSDSSLVTSSSCSHLDSSGSQTYFDGPEHNKSSTYKPKMHSSLTTVLDGHSKFSDCSLVCPLNNEHIFNEQSEQDGSSKNKFPKWVLKIDDLVFEKSEGIQVNPVLKEDSTSFLFSDSLQDRISVSSIYESLSNITLDHNTEKNTFPTWLLDIDLSDTDENLVERRDSVISELEAASVDELVGLSFDVQVDSRGGGDLQTEAYVRH